MQTKYSCVQPHPGAPRSEHRREGAGHEGSPGCDSEHERGQARLWGLGRWSQAHGKAGTEGVQDDTILRVSLGVRVRNSEALHRP